MNKKQFLFIASFGLTIFAFILSITWPSFCSPEIPNCSQKFIMGVTWVMFAITVGTLFDLMFSQEQENVQRLDHPSFYVSEESK